MENRTEFLEPLLSLRFQILSDVTIFIAYTVIAIALVFFTRKRGAQSPFKWVLYTAIAFLALSAITHLTTAVGFWTPLSNLHTIVLTATAIVSILTAFGVFRMLPEILKQEDSSILKTQIDKKTQELEQANRDLETTISDRTKRMQEAQAVADLGFWEMDVATQDVVWSTELFRLFGLDSSFKPSYTNYMALLSKTAQNQMAEAVNQTIKTRKRFDVVHAYAHPDGSIHYFRGRGKAVTKKGEVIRLIGTVQDITKEKLIQDAIIENELMMRSFLKSATDAIIVCGENGNVIKWNKAAERIFGWTEKEMMNRQMDIIMPEKYRPHHAAGIKRHIESGNAEVVGRTIEVEGLKKDGTIFPVELALGSWQINEQHYFCGILRDVSSRKKAENELLQLKEDLEKRVDTRTLELLNANKNLENEIVATTKAQEEINRLAAIVQESDDSILSMKLDGTITSWNAGATKLYGFTAEEAIGQNLNRFCTEEGKTEISNILKRMKQGISIENYKTSRITKDGRIVPVSLTYAPLRNKQGEVIAISGIARNITEQKNAEREQQRLIRKLEATNKELESFAYITSHDLKAPLRAIGSLSDWIYTDYADQMDEEGKGHLMLLKGRVQRMHDLIEGILQYSRVGRKDGELMPIDLNQVVSGVLQFIEIPAHVSITVQKNLPTVMIPKTQPTQVFENLISNAIKYGRQKDSKISIEMEEIAGFWKLSVADNGDGIDPQYQDKIFEIFQTLRSRDEVESTGIGLTIVKKIVENAGGKIWVESEKGKGTTFYFTLPKN